MAETAQEKRDRYQREDSAAFRAAVTPEMRQMVEVDAEDVVAGKEPPWYAAGERLVLKAGVRRTVAVDTGRVVALALRDALVERGVAVISQRATFHLGSGQGPTYSVGIR
jgi:hypothetical protein